MALLPIPPAPPPGSPTGSISSDQFNDLIKIQTTALTALLDIRNELVKSASAMAEMRLEALAKAGAAGTGAAGGAPAAGGAGGKGMLGKLGGLLKGAGAAGLAGGLGIAAVLAGAGLAAGGISLLLNTLAEPGLGKNIRENVDQLLAINEGNAKTLQSLDLLAVFTSLGAGLAVFGVGAGIAGLSSAIEKAFGVEDWAETIHDNVLELLTIAEDAGGKGNLLGGAIAVAASLAMLGVGLAWFGVGSTIAGLSDAILNFANATWATNIKANVLILLSIAEEGAKVLGDATIAAATLAMLGGGLAVFGVGATAGALSDALTNFANETWAQSIKDNVLILLSIADDGAKALGNATIAASTLAMLGTGLMVFGVGATAGALADALTNFVDPVWATNIKANVLILLSLADDGAKGLGNATIAASTLAMLGTGLMVFGVVGTVGALGDALTNFANATWAQNIKDNVLILLSIADDGAKAIGNAAIATSALTILSTGLAIFGVVGTVGALGDALTNFVNPAWAQSIKDNVFILLSIAEEGASMLGDATLVTSALSMLGVGLAVFGVGQTAGALGDALTNFANPAWAQSIKDNVFILLSIAEEGASMVADTILVTAALTGLGVGLAVFGIGQASAALADALTNFANAEWATNIKNNVLTLLSIADTKSALGVLASTGTVFLALSGLAAGIAIFSVGAGVAGIVDGLTNLGNADWATNIKNNVLTLLSIADTQTKVELLAKTGTIFLAMGGLAAAIAIFSIGGGVAGVVDGLTNLGNAEWATNIKTNVLTLLSIAKDAGGNLELLKTGGTVVLALTGLGAALAVFGAGQGIAAFAALTEGETSFAQGIKDEITTLLSIVDEGALAEGQVVKFAAALAGISASLLLFTGSKLVDSLAGAAGGLLNFLSGNESPVTAVLSLADKVDELERVGSALNSVAAGLTAFSAIGRLASVDLKDFAEDLAGAVPAIEAAVMGGKIEGGWFKSDTVYKGLGSADIKYEDAAKNIQALHAAFTGTFKGMEAISAGPEATTQMIESMTIKTAIIQTAIIQGPIAGAIGPSPAGGGATINNNTVTVSPTQSNSVSNTSNTEMMYGVVDPYTATGGLFT